MPAITHPQWARPSCKLCSIQKAPWGLLRFCGRSSRAAHSWSAANSNSEFAAQIGQTGPTEDYSLAKKSGGTQVGPLGL
eukprot:COSAG01_NODE_11996_length_1819_cov_32.463953_2_plen_79_part_00